jgi:hypothetical protein
MNTLMIYSEDVDSGEIYDGEWNLNSKISGQWELTYLKFDGPTSFPWMTSTSNSMDLIFSMTLYGMPDQTQEISATVNFSESIFTMTNKDNIATQMTQDIFDAMTDAGSWLSNPPPDQFIIVYDSATDTFQFKGRWQSSITNPYSTLTQFQIIWTTSTCKDIFGQTEDFSSGLLAFFNGEWVIDYLTAANVITSLKFLECQIEQSSDYVVRSKIGSYPSLIIPTDDIPLTGQTIHIVNPSNILNISIFSPSKNQNGPLPFEGSFIMNFQLKSLD